MNRKNSIIFIIFVLIVAILVYPAIINNKIMIYFEIIMFLTLATLSYFIIMNSNKNYIIDVRFSLLSGYILYNMYTPIMFLFQKDNYTKYREQFFFFNNEDMQKSLLISILFLIGFLLGIIIIKTSKDYVKVYKYKEFDKSLLIISYIMLIISFPYNILPYIIYGFQTVMSYDRWERYSTLFQPFYNSLGEINKVMGIIGTRITVILALSIIIAMTLLKKCSRNISIVNIFTISVVTFFYLFVDGRRRELLLAYAIASILYMYYKNIKITRKQKKKIIIYLSLGFIFLYAYQNFKPVIQDMWVLGMEEAIIKNNTNIEKNSAYESEFGQVYVTNLTIAHNIDYPLLYGRSYLEALYRPIPVISKINELWFGYEENGNQVENYLAILYPQIYDIGGGLGFSPSSESYLNFGYIGCILMGLLMGLLNTIVINKFFNNKYILLYAIFYCENLVFSRASMLGYTNEIYNFVFNIVFYIVIVNRLLIKDNK